ncbi:unnamed protein product [Ilex paraguariensis]|uniref:START domain-containing protein n=1 Tax=Ilex paraguariensis TaxID=185542 RepID=A0ABC8TK07_9AQUA
MAKKALVLKKTTNHSVATLRNNFNSLKTPFPVVGAVEYAQSGKADMSALRAENERVSRENLALRESLNKVKCQGCGVSSSKAEEHQPSLHRLQVENDKLKEELEKVYNVLANAMGKPVTQIPSFSPGHVSLLSMPEEKISFQGTRGSSIDLNIALGNSKSPPSPNQFNGIQEKDISPMIETAVSAVPELLKLLQIDYPFWFKSRIDGRYVIDNCVYDWKYPKVNTSKNVLARMESSKVSGLVRMSATRLVEMFLDSMYGKLHVLSPLVAPREFFFLRYCLQLDPQSWVIMDVSYDCFKEYTSPYRCWRLPSGCMIQDLHNGKSKARHDQPSKSVPLMVTWVENVVADDESLNHPLYSELVRSHQAYGAKRWVVTLQRMCERIKYSMGPRTTPSHGPEGGRMKIMRLSQRMVKNFFAILSMPDEPEFPNLSEGNSSDIRISIRKSNEEGHPGMFVCAATSLWLPQSLQTLFNFFNDGRLRAQWDVLSNGNQTNEIAQIRVGTHPGNCISLIQPFIPHEQKTLILQESCIDSLGALVVYAPIHSSDINSAINSEENKTNIQILPSGILISVDGRSDNGTGASSSTATTTKSVGSLVTVVYQLLACEDLTPQKLQKEPVANLTALIRTTAQKIQTALGCSGSD